MMKQMTCNAVSRSPLIQNQTLMPLVAMMALIQMHRTSWKNSMTMMAQHRMLLPIHSRSERCNLTPTCRTSLELQSDGCIGDQLIVCLRDIDDSCSMACIVVIMSVAMDVLQIDWLEHDWFKY